VRKIKKLLILSLTFLVITLLATPLVSAVPGAEKNNDKFQYFELICSGVGSETYDKTWLSPPDSEIPNVFHGRGGGWLTGDVVELTVGDETFDTDTDPYSVDYATTFDIEVFRNNDGSINKYNLRLADVVTVYYEDEAVGTLVLKITSVVEFTDGAPSGYRGTVMGYGTDALKGVHISAVDLGGIPPPMYMRVGTITGWPEQITNS